MKEVFDTCTCLCVWGISKSCYSNILYAVVARAKKSIYM